MSDVGKIVGDVVGGAAPYAGAIEAIGTAVDTAIKRFGPAEKMSELDRANLQQTVTLELMKQDWGAIAGQLDINKVEAANPSRFVSGWRPYIGWICGTALGYAFIGQPFLSFVVQVSVWLHSASGTPFPVFPPLDITALMTILTGLLGLGGMRTFEKVKGVLGSGH